MANRFFRYFSTLAFVLFTAICINAQTDASTANGRAPQKEDLPKSIKESLEKQRIEKEKKEHDEMIQRGEEALKLSEELEKSVSASNKLSSQDQVKISKIEKIIKKIRKELGGDDDEENAVIDEKLNANEPVENLSAVASAVKKLQATTIKLVDELKKTTRFSVSVIAIQSSNSLLKILKFIRFGN